MKKHYIAAYNTTEEIRAAITRGELLRPYVVIEKLFNELAYDGQYEPYTISASVSTTGVSYTGGTVTLSMNTGEDGLDYIISLDGEFLASGNTYDSTSEDIEFNSNISEDAKNFKCDVKFYENDVYIISSAFTITQAGDPYYIDAVITTTAASETKSILWEGATSPVVGIVIDGVIVSGDSGTYTFAEPGEHSLRYYESTSSIGSGANYDYTAIESVTASTAMTNVARIENCSNLKSVDLPSVTGLSQYSLAHNASLESVSAPNLSYIDSKVFVGDSALTGQLNLEKVTYVGNNAFSGTNVSTLIFGSALTFVGYSAFQENPSLEGIAFGDETLNAPYLELETGLFQNCTSFRGCTFPSRAGNISSSVQYPTFKNCPINTVAFGAGTQELGDGLFSPAGYNFMTMLFFNGTIAPSFGPHTFDGISGRTFGQIYVPQGCREEYAAIAAALPTYMLNDTLELPEVQPGIAKVSVTSSAATSASGDLNIYIGDADSWSATSVNSAVTLASTSGSASGSVAYTVSDNSSISARTLPVTITFYKDGNELNVQKASIPQEGQTNVADVSQTTFDSTGGSGTVAFTFTPTIQTWKAVVSGSGSNVSFSPKSGDTAVTGTTFTVTENTGTTAKNVTVFFRFYENAGGTGSPFQSIKYTFTTNPPEE